MYRVLALDPGGTTGWATYTAERVHNGQAWEYYNEKWTCGQMGPDDHHLELTNHLGLQQTADFTIVCESFEYRNASRPGLVLASVEYIGVVKLFVQERGIDPVVFQTAAKGKGFVKDVNIRSMGLWYPGKRHAMDAMRHLLFYLTNVEKRREMLVKGWK